jgi:hypothetical protein
MDRVLQALDESLEIYESLFKRRKPFLSTLVLGRLRLLQATPALLDYTIEEARQTGGPGFRLFFRDLKASSLVRAMGGVRAATLARARPARPRPPRR